MSDWMMRGKDALPASRAKSAFAIFATGAEKSITVEIKWAGEDLNLRRQCRQIYSLLPLAARAPTQICPYLFSIKLIR